MLDPLEMNNYFPFGMIKEGMFASLGEGYRYGFNGMERDNETKGFGNDLSTFFRGYDPRLGRWKSVDPVTKAMESAYVGFGNNPVLYVDPRGDDVWYFDIFWNNEENCWKTKLTKHDKETIGLAYIYKYNGETYSFGNKHLAVYEFQYWKKFVQNPGGVDLEGNLLRAADGTYGWTSHEDLGIKILEIVGDALIESKLGKSKNSIKSSSSTKRSSSSKNNTSSKKSVKSNTTTTDTKVSTSGQKHHLLSKKILDALDEHKVLKGKFTKNQEGFLYQAKDLESHKGYQTWHREYDKKVVGWLEKNQDATEKEFKTFLHNLHQEDWIKDKIPNVNLLDGE